MAMQGWVACTECGTRYDSATFGFCPRCGSLRSIAATSSPSPGTPATAQTPGRTLSAAGGRGRAGDARRLQAGGAILLAIGLLGLFFVGLALGPAHAETASALGETLASQPENLPGGNLTVLVTADGVPVVANLTLTAGGTVVQQARTDANGTARLALGAHGAAHLAVTAGNRTATRNLAIPQTSAQTLRLDLVRDPAASDEWIGFSGFLATILWTAAALLGLLAAGGLAALLRRLRWLAYLGPAPALALFLLGGSLALSMGGLAMLVGLGLGYSLVVSGRSAFRR
jgi:hypothetical protein